MARENVKHMHECCPQHVSVGMVRMKELKKRKNLANKKIVFMERNAHEILFSVLVNEKSPNIAWAYLSLWSLVSKAVDELPK